MGVEHKTTFFFFNKYLEDDSVQRLHGSWWIEPNFKVQNSLNKNLEWIWIRKQKSKTLVSTASQIKAMCSCIQTSERSKKRKSKWVIKYMRRTKVKACREIQVSRSGRQEEGKKIRHTVKGNAYFKSYTWSSWQYFLHCLQRFTIFPGNGHSIFQFQPFQEFLHINFLSKKQPKCKCHL